MGSGRRQKYEDSTYYCRFRLQRWGAGIQADIKTIAAQHMYAMSVITALTAQNTTGVSGVQEISPDFVAKQLDCIFLPTSPGQRQNWHAVRGGDHPSCGGKAPAVWGQKTWWSIL